jgi:glutaredoxin
MKIIKIIVQVLLILLLIGGIGFVVYQGRILSEQDRVFTSCQILCKNSSGVKGFKYDPKGSYCECFGTNFTLSNKLKDEVNKEMDARVWNKEIIFYSASWCSVCEKARAYLIENSFSFIEKDIGEDPLAEKELRNKKKASGISSPGVPTFEVNGKLIHGFGDTLFEALDKT